MNAFHYTAYAQEVIFGAGALQKLGEAVAVYGWRRLMLCASPSLRKNGTTAAVESADRLVATYEQVRSHVLAFQVAEALQMAEAHRVDAIIGLGGGCARRGDEHLQFLY